MVTSWSQAWAAAALSLSPAWSPAVVCRWRGKFLAVEGKAGKNTTTALQDREIAAIRSAGGIALIINENNLDELKALIE